MFLIDILAAALAAVLTGLGMGSGGVLVIYLTLIADMEQHMAQGINLLFFLFSGGAALTVHAARRHLYPGMILLLSVCGIAGSFLGTALARLLSPILLRHFFGGMLVLTGLASWLRNTGTKKTSSHHIRSRFR